ncbi:MAG: hypothetical protein SO189_02895 [Erysipelotrichaceae bacterium]|nr:hypothetical protein [Solobacterium sp.]MDY3793871.1 hypothetical protein [Erysipelotrichaceae bacterium]
MKKILSVVALSLFLFACSSATSLSTYKFKDLTIEYPSDISIEKKVLSSDDVDLRGDNYLIKIQRFYNGDNQSFHDLRKQYETTAIFEEGCTLLVNDDKHAIYQYNDYGLACIFLGNNNHYYSLISQGDKDALKDNYDWILKSFKNIKVS